MPRKSGSDTDGGDISSSPSHIGNQALQFVRFCSRWARHTGDASQLRSLSLYPPSVSRNGQWLVIGKAWDGGYKLVAFHRSTDPLTALVGFFQRWSQGKLDWKEDTYADKSGGS